MIKHDEFGPEISGFCFNCENYSESLKIKNGHLLCEVCIDDHNMII